MSATSYVPAQQPSNRRCPWFLIERKGYIRKFIYLIQPWGQRAAVTTSAADREMRDEAVREVNPDPSDGDASTSTSSTRRNGAGEQQWRWPCSNGYKASSSRSCGGGCVHSSGWIEVASASTFDFDRVATSESKPRRLKRFRPAKA